MNPTGIGQIYIGNPSNTDRVGAFNVDWMTYLSPFTYSAWLRAILLCLIAPAIMTVIGIGCKPESIFESCFIHWKSSGLMTSIDHNRFIILGNNIQDPRSIYQECIKCYVAMFRSLIMIHNFETHDSKIRTRICSLTIMVCGMLIYWLWEADLISHFAFPSTALPFTTLKGLLDNSDKKVTLYYAVKLSFILCHLL